MYGTLDAIKAQAGARQLPVPREQPLARRRPQPLDIKSFYGAGQEDNSRGEQFVLDAGEPAVLLGADTGPNPAEALLHALAACLTTTLVYVAAARKVRLTRGRVDARGRHGRARRLGVSDEVRNGFTHIRVHFTVKGDAPAEKLREVIERAQARSAVFDMVSHGVPVDVERVMS